MPFEFTGEKPKLAVITSFSSFRSPSHLATPAKSSFGTTTSFAFGSTSSFGVSTIPSPETTTPTPSTAKSATSDEQSRVLLSDREFEDDPLAQALNRARLCRPAVIGDAAISADQLLKSYFEQTVEGDGAKGSSTTALIGDLEALAKSNPSAMRFLRHVFEQATASQHKERSTNPDVEHEVAKIIIHKDHKDRAMWFERLPHQDDAFYNALVGLVHWKLVQMGMEDANDNRTGEIVAYNLLREYDYYDIVDDLFDHNCGSDPQDSEPTILQQRFADELLKDVMGLCEEYNRGWKVDGKDDLSYFDCSRESKKKEGFNFDKILNGEVKEGEMHRRRCCDVFKSKASTDEPVYRSEFLDKPFNFMGLAPELRNRVYRHALVPGTISLRSCSHHLPAGTNPATAAGLLSVNRLCNREAQGFLLENHFIVNVLVAKGTRSVIHRAQLPTHILPHLKSMTFVLDMTEGPTSFNCDWRQLQALTSLSLLRITVIDNSEQTRWLPHLTGVLSEIVMRVPADCKIEYGCITEEEDEHVGTMIDKCLEDKVVNICRKSDHEGHAVEVEEVDLKDAAKAIPESVVPGVKSGVVSAVPTWLEKELLNKA
jgi:hypothetical protein